MKNTLILFLGLALMMLSCKKETTETNYPPYHEKTQLVVSENIGIEVIKDFLPDYFFNPDARLIYKDSLGTEKSFRLKIHLVYGLISENDELKYTYDGLRTFLVDDLDSSYVIEIKGIGGYDKDKDLKINILGFELLERGKVFGDELGFQFDNGKYVKGFSEMVPTMKIWGKEYKDVIYFGSGQRAPTDVPFANFMVNSEIGIIAFNDLNEKKWVFSRVE